MRPKLLDTHGETGSERQHHFLESCSFFGWMSGEEPRALGLLAWSSVLPLFGLPLFISGPWATHPLLAPFCPDQAEGSEDCLDSESSAINIGVGFSYQGVTSHSPCCQQPKSPSICRLQINAKLNSKSMSPNRPLPTAGWVEKSVGLRFWLPCSKQVFWILLPWLQQKQPGTIKPGHYAKSQSHCGRVARRAQLQVLCLPTWTQQLYSCKGRCYYQYKNFGPLDICAQKRDPCLIPVLSNHF